MKKIVLATAAVLTLVFAGACGNAATKDDKEKTTETAKQEFKTKTVDNIDMKIGEIKTTESTKKDKNMVSIAMSFLNNDNAPVGVGAGDFKIKSDGKTFDVYPQGNNFGDEFKPNEKLAGKAYFELPNTVKKGTLVYAPMDKEKASWSITIPEAK
ncbi:DUF4352 domain-containing protein [Listeria booriae]|uniref:DUF4352 domain-containing protein n=1 Tax=Listeria booriae TaxID=1552123 RepID=UPI00162ACF9D|nr:DUF4352 domain-containing protein [Listeria booriae]MBC2163593.1 DUF4352 domain-containing protein [Listeria booriae]MBC2322490.1 DUF4352 domain-containing protein [Listeria booriae]